MDVHESHPRRDRDLENITLEALTVPWRLQFRVDEALYAVNPNGWTCYIEERDQRCLRVTNNCVISLLKSDLSEQYCFLKNHVSFQKMGWLFVYH